MPGLDTKIITAYNATRGNTDKSVLCHAPFTNINFEQTGNATACCYNRKHILGTYPSDTIKDIWFGRSAEQLRQYIRENNLEEGCRMCKLQLESDNYAGFKAKLYDQYTSGTVNRVNRLFKQLIGADDLPYPKVMEFELENTCNLECIMCNGDFSSSIRQNREKRPPLKSPYDKEFVRQLTDFMPHLTDMKFLGGEPFMIDIYHDIWEQVAAINPKIKIHITTNATLLNSRTKKLLEGMNAGINISLDSVVRETYESIRIGASYDRVMGNIDWLTDYTRRKGTYIWFSICPMVINRYEMPGIVQYANERNIGVYFNTVWWPEEQSLRFMDYDQLEELIAFYEANIPDSKTNIGKINYDYFIGFINQVKFWKTEKEGEFNPDNIPQSLIDCLSQIASVDISDRSETMQKILYSCIAAHDPPAKKWLPDSSHLDTIDLKNLASYLREISSGLSSEPFLHAFFECMDYIAISYLPIDSYPLFRKKLDLIIGETAKINEKKHVVSDLIRAGILYQVHYVSSTPIEEIGKMIKNHYT